MKRVFFLTFLSIYLIGSSEFNQLIKLPMIFIHYKNHLADNDKLSFVYFISSHYDSAGDGDIFDDDEESKMPFMKINNFSSKIFCFVSFSKVKIELPLIKASKSNYPNFSSRHISDAYAPSFLRPPIIAV
jgi:hypothetical protein